MSNTKLIAVLLVAVVASTAAWFAFFAKESAPDFTAYAAGPDRKAAFFEYFTPIVVEVNKELATDREQIQSSCNFAALWFETTYSTSFERSKQYMLG